MKIETMHIGQRVRHPQYGPGTVRALCELTATVAFDNGTRQEVAPDLSGLAPAEAHATLSYLETPLVTLLRDTVEATLARLGVERPDQVVERLGARWRGGRLVLHPADPALQTKEVGLEVFFHKIVMVRNNLRVLEQKLNASENLSAAEKFDWQQYITRCYGSLTTFNVLFKEKEDQF
ncbi:MAG: hypothetical protein M5U12_11290 [Verrucomicrobia bacterium]|nr:hypothetical protein [Verrucomicrobiota bacterium]